MRHKRLSKRVGLKSLQKKFCQSWKTLANIEKTVKMIIEGKIIFSRILTKENNMKKLKNLKK